MPIPPRVGCRRRAVRVLRVVPARPYDRPTPDPTRSGGVQTTRRPYPLRRPMRRTSHGRAPRRIGGPKWGCPMTPTMAPAWQTIRPKGPGQVHILPTGPLGRPKWNGAEYRERIDHQTTDQLGLTPDGR